MGCPSLLYMEPAITSDSPSAVRTHCLVIATKMHYSLRLLLERNIHLPFSGILLYYIKTLPEAKQTQAAAALISDCFS